MLRNITVAKRFAIVFSLLGLITLSIGLIGIYEAKSMRTASNEVDKVWLPSIMVINDIDKDFLGVRIITLNIAANRSVETLGQEKNRLSAAQQELSEHKRKYEKLINSPEEHKLYSKLNTELNDYFEKQRQIITLVEQGQFDGAKLVSQGEVRNLALNVSETLEALVTINRNGATRASQQLDETYAEAILASTTGLILAVAVSAFLAMLLTKSIVTPLSQAVGIAEHIAAGDLTQTIVVEGEDEPAQLLHALRAMQKNLGDTVTQIMSSSTQLASAAEELITVSQNTSNNLQKQSLETDQAVTAVNEMATAVDEVARNAVSTSEASKESDQKAKLGRDQVVKAVSSINGLASDVTDTAHQVENLANNVRNISQVLDVIRAIAEQTNLLALNAAIEAARAGDAGRGFAVVADEVRALAHRTQQSTQEIEQMIGSINTGTEQAVNAMQSSNKRAQLTLEIAEKAGQALEEITIAIEQINEKNLLIASASEEQAHVAREVDRNLVNIRDLSVQSSQGAHQTASASHELSVLASRLSDLVKRFRV